MAEVNGSVSGGITESTFAYKWHLFTSIIIIIIIITIITIIINEYNVIQCDINSVRS
jgi:hypothetical protein